MKLLKTALVASVLGLATSANAATIDFDVMYGSSVYGSGSFSGVDSNADNLLSFSELTNFDFVSTSYGHYLDLGDLVDTGDFDLVSNNWIANGISWTSSPDNAFFTWNNRNNSVNSSWATIDSSVAAVPEPSTYALMFGGLGLVGLMAARRKKA